MLGALITACQVLAAEIWPFLPDLAARLAVACHDFDGTVPKPQPIFPRIEIRTRPQYPAVEQCLIEPSPAAREQAERYLAGRPLANVITGDY